MGVFRLKQDDFHLCLCLRTEGWYSYWTLYFTDRFATQWGDDWDDTPAEYNAGEPYEYCEDDERCQGKDCGRIVRAVLHFPSAHSAYSPYGKTCSANKINRLNFPWLEAGEESRLYPNVTYSYAKKWARMNGALFLEDLSQFEVSE